MRQAINSKIACINTRFKLLTICILLSFINLGAFAAKNEQITDLVSFCSGLKGFNLLGKFDVSWSNSGFPENEFKMIHDLGFNFVRLPLDYRTYTKAGNWDSFVETELVKIDKAVSYGEKYNVHVCINLHRAPGFCINKITTLPVNQQLNLWTNIAAQDAFVNHWIYFAERYKDIPAEKLSFNLVNEPAEVTAEVYLPIMKRAIAAIHKISPERVVFVDGINVGNDLLVALKDEPNVAQSIHSYNPFGITHYKAEWVSGSADMPEPHWPLLQIPNHLYGSWKTDFKSAMVIEGNFPKGTIITVNVQVVSIEANLLIKAGTQTVLSKKFVCGADFGTDFTKIIKTEWGYQNISNKDFSGTTNADATKISIECNSGDWLVMNTITINSAGKIFTFSPGDDTWGKKQGSYTLDSGGNITAKDGSALLPFDGFRKNIEIAKTNHIAFMVQEFGVYNKTPHSVTIAFLTDLAKLLKDNNIGWALWNFTGSFGILNSDRADCVYETYQGMKLDRKMLNALTGVNTSAVMNLKSDKNLKAFPCPAIDYLYVNCSDLSGKTEFVISDISGHKIRNTINEISNNEVIKLSIVGLPRGIYILNASNNGIIYSRKIIVQ